MMTQQYWLFKSEPSAWSWDQQKAKGTIGEPWDGVRNYQANNNMKAMKIGDKGFFYHSIHEKSIVGIVEIIKEHELDVTDTKGKFGLVIIKALYDMPKPITLANMKDNQQLEELQLIKQSRLSVVPISKIHWDIICKMGQL
ncbi:MAG: putative RNA-binding protein with PUA-like domain [Alphaproteobacteria bacterium]|jgi:predicted RNA-binding protein with PUA-like domain